LYDENLFLFDLSFIFKEKQEDVGKTAFPQKSEMQAKHNTQKRKEGPQSIENKIVIVHFP